MADLSAIITAHREGAMAGLSLRSMNDAISAARAAGISVEAIAVLDDPDSGTQMVFSDLPNQGWCVFEVCFHDQGKARNYAVRQSSGTYLAFLDADDLWSENWLVEGFRTCLLESGKVIAHPSVNWFFEENNNLFFHVDQDDPRFNPAFLRFTNLWDALCMAPRAAYVDYPYAERDIIAGFAYEDWQWNCETLNAGFRHKVAQGTIHFKRRRGVSQTMVASARGVLTRMTPLHRYDWYARLASSK